MVGGCLAVCLGDWVGVWVCVCGWVWVGGRVGEWVGGWKCVCIHTIGVNINERKSGTARTKKREKR